MNTQYISTANELSDRILKLIPEHPEISELDDCWGLFKIEGFKCDDLSPSFFQASWALNDAKHRYQA